MKPRDMLRTPATFRDHLVLDGMAKCKFGDVIEPWQAVDFAATDAAWMFAAGISKTKPACQMAYLERPRGHSKTTDIACQALWALAASPFHLTGIAAAGDQDQAKLIRDAIAALVNVNDWLARRVTVNKFDVHVRDTGSALHIITSDADSSLGWNPHFILIDELTKWGASGVQLWDSLISSAVKRPECFLCVISNAGNINTWQWDVRERARTQSSWYFHSLDGPQASWITPEALEIQRQNIQLQSNFDRYHLNKWVPDSGGEHLAQDLIINSFRMLRPQEEFDGLLIGGLDIGIRRDASAFSVLKVNFQKGVIELVHHKKWLPADQSSGQVDLTAIEDHIRWFHSQHKMYTLFADSWQAFQMLQQLANVLYCYPIQPNPVESDRQARTLLQVFQDGLIHLYMDSEIEEELGKILIIEKSNDRLKIESPRDSTGHCDIVSSIAVALPACLEILEAGGLPDARDYDTSFEMVDV